MKKVLFAFLLSVLFVDTATAKSKRIFQELYEKTRTARSVLEYISSLGLPKEHYQDALEMLKDPSLRNAAIPSITYYEKTDTLLFSQAHQRMLVTLASQRPLVLVFNGKALLFAKRDSATEIRQKLDASFGESLSPKNKGSFLLSLALDSAQAQFGSVAGGKMTFSPAMMMMFFGASAFSMYNANKLNAANRAIYDEQMEDKRIKKLSRESDRELSTIQGGLGSGTEITGLDCSQDRMKTLEFSLPESEKMVYEFSSDKINRITLKSPKGECSYRSLSGRLIGPACSLGKTFSSVNELPGEVLFKNILTCCKNEVCRPSLFGSIQAIKESRTSGSSSPSSPKRDPDLKGAVTN